MERLEADSGITPADLLTAFSLATDLGLGQPMEHVIRAWQIAEQLATRTALSDEQRESLFFVAMLAWVGCIADSPEVVASFGDDITFRADSFGPDLKGTAAAGFFLRHAARSGTVTHRLRTGAALVVTGGDRVTQGIRSHCLTTSALAERLGLRADAGERCASSSLVGTAVASQRVWAALTSTRLYGSFTSPTSSRSTIERAGSMLPWRWPRPGAVLNSHPRSSTHSVRSRPISSGRLTADPRRVTSLRHNLTSCAPCRVRT